MSGLDIDPKDENHVEKDGSKKYILIKSAECINRMEIASLKRFARLMNSKDNIENLSNFVFFTPCEAASVRRVARESSCLLNAA